MGEWLETYRGTVNPWECDVVQHFTIAYYFDRVADASRNFADHIGEDESRPALVRGGPSHFHATFQHELRAGAVFHIQTAVTEVTARGLRLGHKVIDSIAGQTVAWFTETWSLPRALNTEANQKLISLAVPWPGPKVPERSRPRVAQGPLTARDRVKPWESDEDGVMSLAAHIHRFSAAGAQVRAALGMTAAYMQEHKRGYSTFELEFTQVGAASVGDVIDVTTAVSHLGNSSLHLLHRMTRADGREVAFLVQSGVFLDMEARRSTQIPDELRASIQKLLMQNP